MGETSLCTCLIGLMKSLGGLVALLIDGLGERGAVIKSKKPSLIPFPGLTVTRRVHMRRDCETSSTPFAISVDR